MTNKKKIIYLGVGLIGAYFLFPHANHVVEYIKSKLKKPITKPSTENKPTKKVCNCITTPCNC